MGRRLGRLRAVGEVGEVSGHDDTTTLYRIYGEGGGLLYVGVTSNRVSRMQSHAEKGWWREVRQVEYEDFATRTEALAAERSAIVGSLPKYNRAHVPPQVRAARDAGLPDPAPMGDVAIAEALSAIATQVARPTAPGSPGQRQMWTISQAADYLNLTERSVRRYIADGALAAFRIGQKQIRVDRTDVEALLAPIPAGGAK